MKGDANDWKSAREISRGNLVYIRKMGSPSRLGSLLTHSPAPLAGVGGYSIEHEGMIYMNTNIHRLRQTTGYSTGSSLRFGSSAEDDSLDDDEEGPHGLQRTYYRRPSLVRFAHQEQEDRMQGAFENPEARSFSQASGQSIESTTVEREIRMVSTPRHNTQAPVPTRDLSTNSVIDDDVQNRPTDPGPSSGDIPLPTRTLRSALKSALRKPDRDKEAQLHAPSESDDRAVGLLRPSAQQHADNDLAATGPRRSIHFMEESGSVD